MSSPDYLIKAQAVNAPNFPGMLPSRNSWVHRVQDGFQRSSKPRPKSAQSTLRSGEYSFNAGTLTQDFKIGSNQTQTFNDPFSRPSTAGLQKMRSSADIPTLRALNGATEPVIAARPSTANIFGRTQSTPLLSNSMTATIGLPPKTPPELMRRQPSVPKFVEDDKLVCRFYGYFTEARIWDYDAPLGVPSIERDMTRELVILYYLFDQTVQLIEKREANTGMSGGNFFNRGRIIKADGEPLALADLIPGDTIRILGQEVTITDADGFTRDFVRRELNINLPPKLSLPAEFNKEMGAPFSTGLISNFNTNKKSFGTKSSDYMKTKEELEKIHKFLNFEGHVLRFQSVETSSLDPSCSLDPDEVYFPSTAKRFALSYYLSDDKIDLRIIKAHAGPSTGQEENMVILKKTRICKNWREARRGLMPVYYQPEDFIVGQVVDIYGRYFLLIGCDNFTRANYEDRGIAQREVPCEYAIPEKIVHPIPQSGDGFLAIGSNEDTLATVYGMPKVTKDLKKIQRNLNRNLRCVAKLLTRNPIDATRVFMITFYLEDDTIQIYEKEIRNSGVDGGVFLKRGKYVNDLPPDSDQPRFFRGTDIFYGNVISINGNEMQITEMDNLSLKFCETYPDEFPLFDTFQIVHRLMRRVVEMKLNLKNKFLTYDTTKKGWLPKDNFVAILDSLGVSNSLNDQEMLTMMRRFQESDKYMYMEMCDLFSHVFYVQIHDTAEAKQSTKYLEQFDSFLHIARLKSTQWRRSLRKSPYSYQGYITLSALISVFKKHGFVVNTKIANLIYSGYRVVPNGANANIVKETLKRIVAEDPVDVLNASRKKGLPKKRVDIRSHARFQATMDDDDEEGASLNPIMQRRNFLMKSVLRKKGEFKAAETISDGSLDYSKVVIDFDKVCDDIYVCDWV